MFMRYKFNKEGCSVDEAAKAYMLGESTGFRDGYSKGYLEGHSIGHRDGYYEAVITVGLLISKW